MTVDAVTWDIGGTPLDSEPLHGQARHSQARACRMWEPIG
jgi:hypothetical protein